MPLLEQLDIGPSPQLKEVPSGIHHLQSLKVLKFYDMPIEFELSLQPDNGPDFWKVKHIPSVVFRYRIQGEHYKTYKLGEANSRGGEPKCPPHIWEIKGKFSKLLDYYTCIKKLSFPLSFWCYTMKVSLQMPLPYLNAFIRMSLSKLCFSLWFLNYCFWIFFFFKL